METVIDTIDESSSKQQNDMPKKGLTISVKVRDNLNVIGEISRILKYYNIDLIDFNIIQFPMEKSYTLVIKTQGNHMNVSGIMDFLNNCDNIAEAEIISEHDTLGYGLVTFKLKTRVLAQYPRLQKIMNKFKVEYIDFAQDYFIVGYFGSEVQINKMFSLLVSYGIVEHSRSTMNLLKEDNLIEPVMR